MRVLSGLLLLTLCLAHGEAFVFSSREKAKEPLEKVPCGAHSRVRPNLPAHAQGWLASKWLGLLFIITLYVVLKFRLHSAKAKAKEQSPTALRIAPSRSPIRKNQHDCPGKDYTFLTLTHLEKDLVQFLSKVRELKAAVITGSNLRLFSSDFPADSQSCVTIYEVWGSTAE
ncbi:protein FAM209 isoform X2 [Cavia porcellus]|uniref:protein FAM209 isoform X2 n=1 Tax=Cavia porcellus TaxID=10141 RepID=UPI000184CA38|nr:protein FAM209B [Cavia porcellus]